ncbi:nucleotidyltransferase family protein [Hylemonella gracilis]|uniref:Nucleotidyltransferase family protein n=1 Tax=Hylemonella gracilis TaxID=80880 RepID=A0A4P6UIT9_9BURK|nr:nucleotidyltransferase family protein [Hylemonella gracilis]QBK04000.1 nucleotidyltransferase family protein [Hylemonella gracilis]
MLDTSDRAHALILAAGRGERMRPWTDTTPKPLLQVQGRPLLQWHVDALAAGGCTDLVINTAWLGEQIPAHFGAAPRTSDGQALRIAYSEEGRDFGAALETAGGIVRALPRLAEVFWVVAGDVYTPGFTFSAAALRRFAQGNKLAHLWLVPNPPHNPLGDFGLSPDGLALNVPAALRENTHTYTYSTIGLYRRGFFTAPFVQSVDTLPPGNPAGVKAPLAPMLRAAMDNAAVSAELYNGPWTDVGTPERLRELNATHPQTTETPSP